MNWIADGFFSGEAADELLARVDEQNDPPEREPDDWHDEFVATVQYACGHAVDHYNCRPEDLPGAEQDCWQCRPCPCCGERLADCTCPLHDPFAEEETEEAAFARMSPSEQKADLAYREQDRQQWHAELQSQYQRDAL